MKVMIVCTGNICRSPMAEAMLRHALQERGVDDVEVRSTGTWAADGNQATQYALEVLQERGIEASQHRSTALTRRHLEEADLVIAMTSVHVREVAQLVPEAVGKTLLLKELVELKVRPVPDDATRAERLESLLRAKRPESRRALDLDDPMGLPRFAYVRCADDVEAGIAKLVEYLCGAPPGR